MALSLETWIAVSSAVVAGLSAIMSVGQARSASRQARLATLQIQDRNHVAIQRVFDAGARLERQCERLRGTLVAIQNGKEAFVTSSELRQYRADLLASVDEFRSARSNKVEVPYGESLDAMMAWNSSVEAMPNHGVFSNESANEWLLWAKNVEALRYAAYDAHVEAAARS